MNKIITLLTTICLSISVHAGWETDGLSLPELYKTKLTCSPATKKSIDGVRYPTLVLNQNNDQWSVTSGAITPTAPINYSNLIKIKTITSEKTITEYFQTNDKSTKVKIIKASNQEIISAKAKNAILYNCKPVEPTEIPETESQIIFDILRATENILPINFIEYTMISIKDVRCNFECSGTDTGTSTEFKMTADQSKTFYDLLMKSFLLKNHNNPPYAGQLLTAQSIVCSAGFDMQAHREFSKCEIKW